MERTADGKVLSMMDDAIRFELVLGTHGRSASSSISGRQCTAR